MLSGRATCPGAGNQQVYAPTLNDLQGAEYLQVVVLDGQFTQAPSG